MAKDNAGKDNAGKDSEFGRHELLDRSSMIMDMVAGYILEHKDLKKDEKELAQVAYDSLFELHQLLGARTIGGEDDEEGTRH